MVRSKRLGKIFFFFLVSCLSLTWARIAPFATILPFSGMRNSDEDKSKKQKQAPPSGVTVPLENFQPQQQHDPRKPPPPPPPPNAQKRQHQTDQKSDQMMEQASDTQQQKEMDGNASENPEFCPNPQFWPPGPFDQYGGLPPPPPGWMGPPNWQQQTEWQLEESMARESNLISELQNLTNKLYLYEQREDLHIRQLDVLTERVMDAEAAAALERNELSEYRANCTELGRTVALLQDEIEEWSQRCQNLTMQHQKDEEAIKEIKGILKERNQEVVDLASVIESSRLEREYDQQLVERNMKKKKRGFFAWLFGAVLSSEDSEEEGLQDAQDFARSTLLRALQTERDSVEELENAVATLEQNNTVIAQMVESRDMLIDELNNRVAVFEEDKLVLKAALRQLQKEMKEEAPKTQKLIDDLKDAHDEIHRLKAEMDSIVEGHQSEISLMQNLISQKQSMINASESNMTVIGTYVDKLEERLATFALARRDIDVREKKCAEFEEHVLELESECKELREQVRKYDEEYGELKSLLEDLVKERSELQMQQEQLANQKETLLAESGTLRDTISSLEIDVDSLGKAIGEWRSQVADLESVVIDQTNQIRERDEREGELECILRETLAQLKLKEDEARARVLREQFFDAVEIPQEEEAVPAEPEERLFHSEDQLSSAESEGNVYEANEESMTLKPSVIQPPPPPPLAQPKRASHIIREDPPLSENSSEMENHLELQPSESSPNSSESVPTDPSASYEDEKTSETIHEEHHPEAVSNEIDFTSTSNLPQERNSDSDTGEGTISDIVQVIPATTTSLESISKGGHEFSYDTIPLESVSVSDDSSDELDLPKLPDEVGSQDAEISVEPQSKPDFHEEDFSKKAAKDATDDAPLMESEISDDSCSEPDFSGESAVDGTVEESKVSATEMKPTSPVLSKDLITAGAPPKKNQNKVPFRSIRKAFSKRTGMHGVFTKPSRFYPTRQQKRQATQAAKRAAEQAKLSVRQQEKK